jgi:hypothetical protein
MQLQAIFVSRLMWGYFVTIAVLVAAAFLIHHIKHRMAHDLWDVNARTTWTQFTIKQLMGWSILLALLLAYYQNIETILSALL